MGMIFNPGAAILDHLTGAASVLSAILILASLAVII
jgi:hypothetical protein